MLFDKLWQQYVDDNPGALSIYESFGEEIVNDHIALRTFDHPEIDLFKFIKYFAKHDYVVAGDYSFPGRHIRAVHLAHPDPKQPKIFISQLITSRLSPNAKMIIWSLMKQIYDQNIGERDDLPYSGRHWDISYDDYQTLTAESEYAGWVAAHGFRANHFTVFVNELKNYNSLEAVLDHVGQKGYLLNHSGGLVKGSAEIGLKQGSTISETVEVPFYDGMFYDSHLIPGCFYEFASRHEVDGELYQGFVTASADKIFDSTNTNPIKD